MNNKKYYDEIKNLNHELGHDQGNQQININLAQLFSIVGKYEMAIYYYKNALDIQEQYDLYFLLAECYEIIMDNINSIKYYNESLRLNLSITENDKSYKLMTYKRLLQIHKKENNYNEITKIIKELEKEKQFNEIINNIKHNYIKKKPVSRQLFNIIQAS